MASVVLTMNSPHAHGSEQQPGSSPMIFRKKRRRGPKKQKKNKKPYFKLSWKEKEEVNEKDRIKGEARLANNKISAPNNTTQFLMQEHPTSTPNQTPVGMCYDSDEDCDYNSISSDDNQGALQSSGVFMENDFAETFENIKAETLDSKSKSQLISDIVNLEKTVSDLVSEREKERHTSADANTELFDELTKLRRENEMLKKENQSLKEDKLANNEDETPMANNEDETPIPVTPVKDNFGFLDLDDASNATNT